MLPTLLEINKALATLAKVKIEPESEKRPETSRRSASEPLPRKYRWRKLKMAYSEMILAMYPYMGEFDSDGDDDIEEGEEDEFVRWDPVDRIHVPRNALLRSTRQNGAKPVSATVPEDNVLSQSLDEDQLGLEVLLEAAKVVSEDSIDSQDDLSTVDTSSPLQGRYNMDDEVVSASSPSSESESTWSRAPTPQRKLNPGFPPVHMVHASSSEDDGSVPSEPDYPPTPGREWDSQLQKVKEVGECQVDSSASEAQKRRRARSPSRVSRSSSKSPKAAETKCYTGGDVAFQSAVDDAIRAILATPTKTSRKYSELTWSQVPTPQSKLSPGYSPLHPIYVPEDEDEPIMYDYPPTPGREWDLRAQERRSEGNGRTDSPGKSQISTIAPEIAPEAMQICETDPETNLPLEKPGCEIVISEEKFLRAQIGEVECCGEADLELHSIVVDEIITLSDNVGTCILGGATQYEMKAHSEIPFGPNRHHPARKSKIPHISHHNECKSIHRFHGFRRQINLGGGIKYRRGYVRPRSKVIYKQKMLPNQGLSTMGEKPGNSPDDKIYDSDEPNLEDSDLEEGEIDEEEDEDEDVGSKMDRICQHHGLPSWLSMLTMVDYGYPVTQKQWEMINKDISRMKCPGIRAKCLDEMMKAGYVPPKSPQIKNQVIEGSEDKLNQPTMVTGDLHEKLEISTPIPAVFQSEMNVVDSNAAMAEKPPVSRLAPDDSGENGKTLGDDLSEKVTSTCAHLVSLSPPGPEAYHAVWGLHYACAGSVRTSHQDAIQPTNTATINTSNEDILIPMEGSSTAMGDCPELVALGLDLGDADETGEGSDTDREDRPRAFLEKYQLKYGGGSVGGRVPSSAPGEHAVGVENPSHQHGEGSTGENDQYRNRHGDSSRKEHSSHRRCGSSDANYSSHRHRDSSSARRSSRNLHDNSSNARYSPHKYHKDPADASSSSHKHHGDSKEQKSHNSRHHRHRHHERRGRSRSRSRSPRNTRKRPHRHHRSHREDEDSHDRSHRRAKNHSSDRGHHSSRDHKYHHDSKIMEHSNKVDASHKRSHRSPSDPPTPRFMSAHQQQNALSSLHLHLNLPETFGRDREIPHHRAREPSPDHSRHDHRHRNRHRNRHYSHDSSRSSVGHAGKPQSPSASSIRQSETLGQQEKASIGTCAGLQNEYGYPNANSFTGHGSPIPQARQELALRLQRNRGNSSFSYSGLHGSHEAGNNPKWPGIEGEDIT